MLGWPHGGFSLARVDLISGTAENEKTKNIVLTHMLQIDFPNIIVWMSPFSIYGKSGVIFLYFFTFL